MASFFFPPKHTIGFFKESFNRCLHFYLHHMMALSCSRFSVLYKYHKVYAIKASTLRALLQKIKRHKGYLPTNFTLDQIKEAGHKSSDWVCLLAVVMVSQ